jgi:hypothetical protein
VVGVDGGMLEAPGAHVQLPDVDALQLLQGHRGVTNFSN